MFLLFPYILYALDNEIPIPDSLQTKLTLAQHDTSRLDAMYNIAFWMAEHRTDLVEDYFPQVLALAQQIEHPVWTARTNSLYGRYYFLLPDYEKSFQYYYRAIAIYDSIGNKTDIAGVYHNIAGTFEATNDVEKALSFYRKAVAINSAIGKTRWLMRNYNSIGLVYANIHKYDSAIYYFTKSLDLATSQKNTKSMQFAHASLGGAYTEVNRYKEAETHLKTAYELSIQLKDNYLRMLRATDLGHLYIQMNRLEEAEKFLQEALTYSEKQAYKSNLEASYYYLSDLEQKKGNLSAALEYYKKFHAIRDTVLNEEKNKSIREFDIKYQSQKKEKENTLLRKENTINRLKIYGLAFIALLFALFIAYFYYINQKMKHKSELITRQKDELFAANQRLNALLKEKDNIIATVSHDYRSPLGRIRAVIDLVLLNKENLSEKQQKHLQKIPIILAEATHLIDDLLDVTYIDRLKEQLHSEKFEIKKEISAALEDYQDWISLKQLQVKAIFPDTDCNIYTDKPAFRRIFDNLISNAVKYAPLNTNITLNISQKEKGYSIQIQDEGPGFSEEDKKRIFTRFQRLSAQPIAVGNSYGLGLSIVKTLVDGLGATIRLEDTAVGAHFCIEIADNLTKS